VGLASLAPFVGLIEAKRKGQAVYSTGLLPGTANRFPGHLLTNILGALAAYTFWWVAHSTLGFDQFVATFPNNAAFNVMLPLSGVVVFAFVSSQQMDARSATDDVPEDSDREAKVVGFSLGHGHQVLNVLHLIAVTFIASTSFLYLVAFGMRAAKAGQPLAVSWQVILTILATLGFLYALGLPWSRGDRAVYLTFLTGTPAALGGAAIWLSWFRDDAIRNVAAASIVGVGYVLYCVEAVLADRAPDRARDEEVHMHYFSATGVAVVLAVLLGTMYVG
jgi:hypothetical protein